MLTCVGPTSNSNYSHLMYLDIERGNFKLLGLISSILETPNFLGPGC